MYIMWGTFYKFNLFLIYGIDISRINSLAERSPAALTVLAQLNPLVFPRRSDLRPETHAEVPDFIKMVS